MNSSNDFALKLFIMAAPVRLELTTHGLTAKKSIFEVAESLYFKGIQRVFI